jgi:hypothetical protein
VRLDTSALAPVVVSVDDLVHRGVEFDGEPVVLVGRVKSYSSLPGAAIDYGTQEAILTGKDRRSFVIATNVGLGSDTLPSSNDEIGKVAVLAGIPIAVGRARAAGNPIGQDTVEFAALASIEPNPNDPVMGPGYQDA